MNVGRLFEQRFYSRLLEIQGIECIYDENMLRKMYGWKSAGIDFLLVIGRYTIPIQLKYKKSRRREDDGINHFLEAILHTSKHVEKTMLQGFWISRRKPFDDNLQKLLHNNIQCIDYFHSMDDLLESSIHKLQQALHSLEVVC